jgi:hypothetical protein
MNKLHRIIRKIHRYLTIPFVVFALLAMVLTKGMPINHLIQQLQKLFTLSLAFTGIFMFLYPYYKKLSKNK